MFLIQTPPMTTMGCMKDYVHLLLVKAVHPHLKAGVTEIHVIFDNPGSLPETPKEIEHRRRDSAAQDDSHACAQLSSEQPVPAKWRALLSYRVCKKALPQYVAQDMLQIVPSSLCGNQSFTTNIGCTAYTVSSNAVVHPVPTLRSNADELDLRLWLHCANSQSRQKLIFSPDTDIYHIGVTIAQLILKY